MSSREQRELRLEGRIEMHLNGGFTKLRIMIGGNRSRFAEIPTESIPAHLRSVGSKVLVTYKQVEKATKVGDEKIYLSEEMLISDFPVDAELGFFAADPEL